MGCRLAHLALLALVLPGCASASSWLKIGKESFPKADSSNPVVRILAVWQVGEGQNAEGMTTRGFVGQIFLLDAQKQVPVAAEGSVRIYLFDDQGTEEERDRPIHQHDFPVDSWRVRLTKTKMGPAYVLFTPYTRKGAHKAECSLRIKFTPADGGAPVFSDLAPISLPGRSTNVVETVARASQSTESTAASRDTRSANASTTARDATVSSRGRSTDDATDKRAFAISSASLQDAIEEARRSRNTVEAVPLTPGERARIESAARERWGDAERSPADDLANSLPSQPLSDSPAPGRHPLADDDEPDDSEDLAPSRPRTSLARPKSARSTESASQPIRNGTPSAAVRPRCLGNRAITLALPESNDSLVAESLP